MMRILLIAIAIAVVGVAGLVWAGAKDGPSSQPPSTASEAAPGSEGDAPKDASRATQAPAGKPDLSPSSQPENAKGPTSRPANESGAKNLAAALQQAADAGKHLFVFVYERDDEQMRAGRRNFDAAVARLGDAVQWIAVDRSAPSEREFVEKYGLKAAPMPLVLSFAPNGTLVGGFLGARLTEQHLVEALASPGMQACLQALEQRKLVLLCVQNGSTRDNDAAMKGVDAFRADPRFAGFTEIVKVDPSDAVESKFLAQLQVDPKTDQATTVFLVPPGAVVGKFSGATDKTRLIATLQRASSGCGGGCGPSGCGPRK